MERKSTTFVPGCRFHVFLPVNTINERQAAADVVFDLHHTYYGLTHSSLDRPGHIGYWYDPEAGELYVDQIAIANVDMPVSAHGTEALEILNRLKRVADQKYVDNGSEQIEIWVTSHQLIRPE